MISAPLERSVRLPHTSTTLTHRSTSAANNLCTSTSTCLQVGLHLNKHRRPGSISFRSPEITPAVTTTPLDSPHMALYIPPGGTPNGVVTALLQQQQQLGGPEVQMSAMSGFAAFAQQLRHQRHLHESQADSLGAVRGRDPSTFPPFMHPLTPESLILVILST